MGVMGAMVVIITATIIITITMEATAMDATVAVQHPLRKTQKVS